MKHVFLACALIASAGAFGRSEPSAPAAASLADFFKPGIAFLDTNDDGVIDSVNARIVLSSRPTAAELSAAANVAARLGFETSAMDLPMANTGASAGTPSIFVGAGSLANSGMTAAALGGSALKAGEGVVAAFTSASSPAIAVLGGDDDGLSAAATMVAGHLPLVWDQKGPSADKLTADVKQYFDDHKMTASSVTMPALLVSSREEGVDRAVIDAQMATADDVVKAQVALNQLKAVGGRDPKRALSYASVRTLRVRIRGGGASATVDLPRTAVADTATPPPGRRPMPSATAKQNFDLSTFYANEGALADTDNNLIPDRTDVVLSADGEGAEGVVDLAARLGLESTGIQVP